MIVRLGVALSLLAACGFAAAQQQPQGDDPAEPREQRAPVSPNAPLPAQCQQSIDRAVRYLLAHQGELGAWIENERDADAPGRTALVGLALLSAGQSHQSPALVRAARYLRQARLPSDGNMTYNVALRAAFFAQLPEPMRKTDLPRDLTMLRETLLIKPPSSRGAALDAAAEMPGAGLYSYGAARNRADFSNSQYGVLGVWYAALSGLEVPNAYWSLVETGWRRGQQRDGGWGYTEDSGMTTGSMTAAGVATLFITYDYLHAKDEQSLDVNNSVNDVHKKRLTDGLDWLGRNFAVNFNPGRDVRRGADDDQPGIFGDVSARRAGMWVYYMLFGFERAGEASGITRFGEHKWFDEGARFLIGAQNYDGSWEGDDPAGRLANTAYAVLFLSRGRAPVAMQKLQYTGARWNNRSRDAATLAKWLSRQTERHTNWQIVSPDATAAELRESPILYAAGDDKLVLTPEQKQRIKTFIDQGGLLLAVNDGKDEGPFASSVRSVAEELYPAYQFRALPADHPIFNENFPVSDATIRAQGLSNSIRELIVLLPAGDFTWRWQAGAGTTDPARAPAFGLIGNLWLYVTDKANPRFKGEDTWIDRDESARPADRALTIARLRHSGNWDPEPLAWTRLANMLHNAGQLELTVKLIDATAELRPDQFAIAHLTATDRFDLTPDQVASLKHYVDTGGLLLFDAAGGSTAASISFEQTLAKMYPNVSLAPLPPNHPIYAGINAITWRRFALSHGSGRTSRPQLRAATIDGRIIAMTSAEDLTAALTGYNIDGITGYTPASAYDLFRNLLTWRVTSK